MSKELLKKIMPGSQHPTAMRAFTNSSEFRTRVLGKAVAEALDEVRESENDPEKVFTTQEVFAIAEQVKRNKWKELSSEMKSEWTKKAQDITTKCEEMN